MAKVDFDPRTQGKVHPLQGDKENFLGYFTREFFPRIVHKTKRTVLTAPEDPKLHWSVRAYPVFVDHNEAREQHYALYAPSLHRRAARLKLCPQPV